MADDNSTTFDDEFLSKEEANTKAIAFALLLTEDNGTWAEQDRAVYTSEVMERELDNLFPVESFLEKKRKHLFESTKD